MKGEPLRVSCTWNRFPKRITRLALVLQPRVTDAVIMAVFTNKERDEMLKEGEAQVPLSVLERIASMFGFGNRGATDSDAVDLSLTSGVAETPAVPPVVETPVVTEADFNQRVADEVERRIQSSIETARFAAENEAAVDALVAAFKVLPAERDEYIAHRATNPAVFDQMAKSMKVLTDAIEKPAGVIDASDALAHMMGDPITAEKIEAQRAAQMSTGLYQM